MTPEEKKKRLRLLQLQAQAKMQASEGADMSTWGRIKDNVIGVDDGVMSTGEKIGTWFNKAGESASFGIVGDEADAALAAVIPGGKNYDEALDFYRRNEAQLERENPGAALGAEIVGGLAGAALPFGAIGTLGRGVGMGTRMLASGAAGAGMGGLYNFMEGEGTQDRLGDMQTGMAFGAGAGLVAPLAAAGAGKVVDALLQKGPIRRAVKSAQTAAEQRASSGAQYKAFDDAGAEISIPAFRRMIGEVDQAMRAVEPSPNIPGPLGKPSKSYRDITKSLTGMDQVATQGVQNAGGNVAGSGIKLSAIEDVRKAIGPLSREVTPNFRPTRGAVSAMRATAAIDDVIDNLQPEDLVAGDKDAAISALKKARELWRRSIKTQKVEDAIEAADDYLSGSASGIRNQFKSLLRRDKKEKLFTPAERAFLKKAIGGNVLSRTVRMAGSGLGRLASAGLGAMTGGPVGAMIGAGAGELASQISDNAAMRNAEIVRALVASGALSNLPKSPEALQRVIEALTRRTGAAIPQLTQ